MSFAQLPATARTRRPNSAAIAGLGIGAAVGALIWVFLMSGYQRDRSPGATTRLQAATAGSTAAALPRSVPDLQTHLRSAAGDWQGWAALGLGYVDEARATGNPSLYPKATGALDRSLALHPDGNVVALAGRGALANARHDFAGGLRFADQAAALDAQNPQVAAIRGDSLIELGRYDEAFAAYQHLVDIAPGLASYTRASYALDLQGDVAGAGRTLDLALGEALSPNDRAFADFSLGELAWNRGDLNGARQHYQRATQADPLAVGPKVGLARLDTATGATDRAITEWRDVVGRSPLPEYVGELGNLYQVTGQAAAAQQQFDLLEVQRALLAANGVNGDLEIALFSADHGVDLERGLAAAEAEWGRRQSIHAADALAWQLHAHGRDAGALPLADRALHLGTPNALFFFHRGMIRRSLGQTTAAAGDLRQALAINPHFSTLHAPTAASTLAALETGARR
jgi:tetratricopeptide (TPR) repeat protein